ncbi:MAG: ribosome small subunit-dependent GTPase A [Elusimicrobiales bacterium]|nr:ribosome small subunit-dependent GTPase A [Elusimicrobiales bacterium]
MFKFNAKELKKLGADYYILSNIEKEITKNKKLIPARIITQYSSIYDAAITPSETLIAILSGSFKKKIKNKQDIPVVGDWVILADKNSNKFPINSIIKRKTLIFRNHPYKGIQPIVANVDNLFLTFSLDPVNFNIDKIKQYLTLNINKNIKTFIILNKMDLLEKDIVEKILLKIQDDIGFTPSSIITLDSISLIGYEKLKSKLIPFETSTFIGPSGTGKSTIINNLYGKKILKTYDVNKKTYKGRHTTTTRKIIILDNNHIVIDTPGITFVNEDIIITEKFSKIMAYALECRFSNCKHISEPGCYVKEMLSKGKIPEILYKEYIDIMKKYEKI